MSKARQREACVVPKQRNAVGEADVQSELERAALVEQLLEDALPAAQSTVVKPEVFTVSVADGEAMTGCRNGGERHFLQWSTAKTHTVLAEKSGLENNGTVWLLEAQRAALLGIEPKGPLESLLIQQALISHELAANFARRSLTTEDPHLAIKFGVQYARLAALSCEQALSIQRLRGEGGHQQVTVQHLTLESGARAVVGNVRAGAPGDRNLDA